MLPLSGRQFLCNYGFCSPCYASNRESLENRNSPIWYVEPECKLRDSLIPHKWEVSKLDPSHPQRIQLGDWLGKEPESNNCSLDTVYFETGMKGWKIWVPYSLSSVYCTHAFGPYLKLLPRLLTRIREHNLFISQGSSAPAPFLFRAPTAARFFCHFESEQAQPSSFDYYRDEPNPEYEP